MSSSRTFDRHISTVLTFGFLAFGFAQVSNASVLYLEEFPNDTTGNVRVTTVGWTGYNGTTGTDQSASEASSHTGVSFYTGCGTSKGFAMFRPANETGNVSMIHATSTEFAPIDISDTTLAFSWHQWVQDYVDADIPGSTSRLAIDVDGTWYASKNVFANSENLAISGTTLTAESGEAKSLALSAASGWYQLTVNPGVALSLGEEASLPTSGHIVAAGLYGTAMVAGDNAICVDNFQIDGMAVPEPNAIVMLAVALLGLCAYAWRKRR